MDGSKELAVNASQPRRQETQILKRAVEGAQLEGEEPGFAVK